MLTTLSRHNGFLRVFIVAIAILTASSGCSTEAKIERYLARGDEYLADGKYREAIIEFLNVIQLDEDNREATGRLAIALYDTGQLGPAFRYLQKAAEHDPNDMDVRVKLGTIYLLGGQREEAREEAGAVLEADGKNLDALAIYANTVSTEGEVDGAIRHLENARAEQESKAKFHLALGALHLRKQEIETAEKHFQEAARVEPDSPDAHLALGTFYAAKREIDKAEAEFDKAAETAPVQSAAQIRVVDFYRLLGKPEEGNRRLDELVERAPDFYPAWQRIAQYSFADKNYTRCEEALNHLLEANPQAPETLRMLGEVLLAKGETEQAQERFRETVAVLQDFVQRRPEQASAHFRLAQMHMRLGEATQAKGALRTVLNIAPNSPSAALLLAELEINTGAASEAIPLLEELIQRQPSGLAYELLGKAYVVDQSFSRSTQAFTKFVEIASDEPRAHHLLGASLSAEGKNAEAVSHLNEALLLDPAYVEPLALLASLDARKQRLGAALNRVHSQIQKIDATGRHHFLLGQLYAASNQLDNAENAYHKAVEVDPSLNAAYAQLAGIYIRTNRTGQALAEMERGLEHNPENVPIIMLKGMIQHQIGEVASAQGTYEQLLTINDRFAPAANNLAYIYQDQGKLEEALALAEVARQEAPNNPDIADTLGWILYKRGTYDRAVGLLKEAAAGRPENAEIWFHLGFCHNKLGEFNDTARAFRKAIELQPESPLAAEAQAILDELR